MWKWEIVRASIYLTRGRDCTAVGGAEILLKTITALWKRDQLRGSHHLRREKLGVNSCVLCASALTVSPHLDASNGGMHSEQLCRESTGLGNACLLRACRRSEGQGPPMKGAR